jgi:dipeptidase
MCDTLAIVRSDRVLFAKNSDRDPNESQFLDWQPRRAYPPGAMLKCTWIEIPQAAETHAVLLSRPFWIWGAEMGANEHGVTIGNEAVFTRAPLASTGLTGMDLVRLALERARTAAEAVQTIVALVEEFGQGGACSLLERPGFTYHNSFIVADPKTAFVLETAGREHAIEEIRGPRSISNGLTIPSFAHHSDFLKTRVCGCRHRQPRTQHLAERADRPLDLVRILRDHGAGNDAPRYGWLNGGLHAPCVHAGGVVASSQTTASWVAELRPGAIRHWVTGTAAPCTSLFKPVAIDQPLDLGRQPSERADEQSLWWRHELLHRAVMRDPARLGGRYFAERDEIEAAWHANPPEPASAFEQGARFEDAWTARILAAEPLDIRPRFVRRYWAKRDALAGLQLASEREHVAATA